MDKSLWRSKARFVAYLQLAFLVLSVIPLIFFGILLCDATFSNAKTGHSSDLKKLPFAELQIVKHYFTDVRKDTLDQFKGNFLEQKVFRYLAVGVPIYLWWIAYLIVVAVIGIKWWVSSQLMRATKIGTAPAKAFICALIWRRMTAGFLTLKLFMLVIFLYAALSTTGQLHLASIFLLIATFIDFVLLLSFYSVVCMFITELEMYSPVYFI